MTSSDLTVPEDGMKITHDTKFAPGVYYLPNGISIANDSVTLDGNGALIIGNNFAGRGLSVNQKTGVRITNLQAERYYHGIWVNASANIAVEHCSVTRTHELAGPDVFLDIWLDRSEAYGGGIFFNGVIDGQILNNDVQHQQNGILIYGCNQVALTENNASFNSGAGVLLDSSSDCSLERNVADYCSRIYHYPNWRQTGRYHNGADAAGLVMMNSSCNNHVHHNWFRSGGDGVFLGGFHKDQIKVPCNDNVFEHNDCSWSPNIAFEATFSQRNKFSNNKADNCNFGFWLGYSSHNTVEDNMICGNRIAGVAIEHGHHNTIKGNTFEKNREGVQLWVGARPPFIQFFPDCAESHETQIVGNAFSRHDYAVRAWSERGPDDVATQRCHHFNLRDNSMHDNRVAVQFERVRESTITGNKIFGNVETGIKLIGCNDVTTDGNRMNG